MKNDSINFNIINENQINNDELKTCKQNNLSLIYQ